jgi:hypothetical protein
MQSTLANHLFSARHEIHADRSNPDWETEETGLVWLVQITDLHLSASQEPRRVSGGIQSSDYFDDAAIDSGNID